LARFRGWSTLLPRSTAMWYASSCSGTLARIGVSTSCARDADAWSTTCSSSVSSSLHADDAPAARLQGSVGRHLYVGSAEIVAYEQERLTQRTR
jgi:hypothetical protein